jgi:predicted nucleotidyltransferase
MSRSRDASPVAERALVEVRRIVREALGEREATLYLFGSWSRGTATAVSDIDVAIDAHPRLPPGLLARVRERLEESHVPYRVEVVDLAEVDPTLRRRILAEGVPWSD